MLVSRTLVALDSRKIFLTSWRGSASLPFSSLIFFPWLELLVGWKVGHALYASLARAYFSALASISEKSVSVLFSSEKRIGYFHSPFFMVVIANAWSRLYTSKVAVLNWLIYDLRDSCSLRLL